MLKELTEEEKRIGREKIIKYTEELKRKMDAGEDYKIEYFNLEEDEMYNEKKYN